VNTGVLAAGLVNLGLSATLSPAQVGDWGWRIGFLVGGVIGFIAFLLRRGLGESRAFEGVRDTASKQPFLDALKANPVAILLALGVMAATGAFNGLLFAHMPAFFTSGLHYDPKQVALAQNLALAAGSVSLILAAWLGDRIPRRWILRAGALALAVLAWPFYRAMADRSFDLLAGLTLAGIVSGLANGTFAAVASDLFPTRVRFTSLGVSLNLGMSLTLGLSPLIATDLVKRTGDLAAPAWVMIACALVTFGVTFLTKRREGHIGAP
jgi:MHS family proline/betaine transporter-like MFS transporter